MTVRGEQCTSTSKRTGQRCGQYVIGGGPCRWHGGAAPQVRRKREERITFAQALAADPRRSPAEVLSNVLHAHDHVMRRALAEVDAKQPTADTMTKLLAALDQAGRWAKTALDAEVDQRQTRVLEVQAAVIVGVFERALGRVGLQPAQLEAAKEALATELEAASDQEEDA